MVLYLNLTHEAFDVMVTQEKTNEYRKPTKWIKQRLYYPDGTPKPITHIYFVRAYGGDKPYFICKLYNYIIAKKNYKMSYSNGLKVDIRKGDFNFNLGSFVEVGNLEVVEQLNFDKFMKI